MRRNGSCGHWKKSDRQEAVALRLLLLTGARKSEILKARWENVHLDLRLLIVPLSKSGKPRHIILSDAALEVLRAMPRTPGTLWLFPGSLQESLSAISISFGINSVGNWDLPMCAFTTCDILSPVFS